MRHTTRKILDYNYGVHITVSYHDDMRDPNPYRVHLITWNPESLTYRRKQIAKYADLPSVLHYVTWYLTYE